MSALLRMLADLLLRFLRTLDLPLMAALLTLMAIGLANLYSASGQSTRVLAMQAAYFCVGLGVLWVASRAPAHLLKQATPAIYLLSLLPLVLVLFIGSGKYGNHWINLGFFNFQPSELAKLTLPMMLAWYMDRQRLPARFGTLPMAALILALPVGLILLQRDFGTAMLVLMAGVFVLFLAGLSWWWFVGAAAAVAAL
ncbi:MAG: FtsW/RodA/SpoVE family cell cycle protein, partial [Thermomonas sp.]|uniref:FtsW/RodA/SpoVE family cell cycle protein n=1 Tax=Thermomonas sp. TaxID=1971895 RepID=UPI0039E4882C